MRKLSGKLMIGWVAAALLASSSAFGQARGYVVNGEGWMKMSPQEKAAYVQGLNDAVNFPYVNDDLETAVTKLARSRCLVETKTAPNILSDIITTAYTRNPALMKETPLFVYVVRLGDICRLVINEERARMGLPQF